MLLEVSGLRAGYGRHEVLHGVDIYVAQGEVVAVVGSNGAGKTTLLRTICGPVRPMRGSVRLDGREVGRLSAVRVVRSGVAHVPEGRHIFPTLTVMDHLRLGAYRSDRTGRRRETRESIDEAFELFPRLAVRRRQIAGSLSGGEQQMLVLARALISRPKLLLIDEPSLGLAPRVIETIFDAIVSLRATGMTLGIVEQNARLALEISDRAYVLEQGRVVLSGQSSELANDQRIVDAYLRPGRTPGRAGHSGYASRASPHNQGGTAAIDHSRHP